MSTSSYLGLARFGDAFDSLLRPATDSDGWIPFHQTWAAFSADRAPAVTAAAVIPPTALPDVDRTIDGVATGNILTGASTVSGGLGKDYGGTGHYVVAAGVYNLAHGTLTLEANGEYTYVRTTPLASLPAGTVDTFSYDFVDAKGVVSNFTTLSISLDPSVVPVLNPVTNTQSGSGYDEVFNVSSGTALGLGGDDVIKDVGLFGATLVGGAGNDILIAGTGHSILNGGAGGDVLDGSAGVAFASYQDATAPVIANLLTGTGTLGEANGDTLTHIYGILGGKGGDTLIGDNQANELIGNGGNDTLAGNGGDDLLVGSAGADALDGGSGTDTVYYSDAKAAIVLDLADLAKSSGDAKGDTFSSVEIFVGGVSADTMIGDANDNNLQGSFGDDKLYGGAGNDHLEGQFGHNLLYGGDGNDDLYVAFTPGGPQAFGDGGTANGENGDDTLHGWINADVLNGGAGLDLLDGGGSDDTLDGGADNDILTGDEGNDKLLGGDGNDILQGGNGFDVLIGGAGADTLIGGAGPDLASYETSTGVVIASLASGGTVGDAAGDTYNSLEGLKGGSNADELTGDTNDNTLFGEAGNDVLTGGDGNDQLLGGSGADHLDGSTGFDVASYEDATAAVILNLADPTHSTGDAKGDTYVSIEEFTGSFFGDTMIAGIDPVSFDGLRGDDKLTGGDANDSLVGGGGNDLLNGGGGNDLLTGSEGNDTAFGGSGDDVVQGDDGNDKLDGGTGDDQVHGGDGQDTLSGGDGTDLIDGEAGNDKLSGDAGNDLLFGDEGDDTLTGGTGGDTFLFLAGQAGKDKITDFNPQEDTLEIGSVLNGPGNDIQDLIDAGFGVTTSGSTLTITQAGGATAITLSGWKGGEVDDIHTLSLVLGNHLVVTH